MKHHHIQKLLSDRRFDLLAHELHSGSWEYRDVFHSLKKVEMYETHKNKTIKEEIVGYFEEMFELPCRSHYGLRYGIGAYSSPHTDQFEGITITTLIRDYHLKGGVTLVWDAGTDKVLDKDRCNSVIWSPGDSVYFPTDKKHGVTVVQEGFREVFICWMGYQKED